MHRSAYFFLQKAHFEWKKKIIYIYTTILLFSVPSLSLFVGSLVALQVQVHPTSVRIHEETVLFFSPFEIFLLVYLLYHPRIL